MAGDRSLVARRVTLGLLVILCLTCVAGLAIGAAGTSLWAAIGDMAAGRDLSLRDKVVLWEIRLPVC